MNMRAVYKLVELGYTESEISTMTWNQVFDALHANDHTYCEDCGYWLHIDQFNDDSSYCVDCE